ncbi:MAG: AzlD domain-containing protein [Rhizobiaceae bacterium]|nr:AzlD domain-containing protein [Rhizobiaceae bacterium]
MVDFLNTVDFGDNLWVLIIVLAIVTYMTRIGGDLVLSRFKSIHPRVDAALEAVPAAVITAIVIPPALTNGPSAFIAMMVTMLACYKTSPIISMVIGMGTLAALRYFGL